MDSLQIPNLCAKFGKSHLRRPYFGKTILGWSLTVLWFESPAQGQFRPSVLPLSIHREAAINGWIPGQWSWPSTPSRSSLQWTSSIGGRYHPAVPALSEFTFALGYSSSKDWLTLGITQYGSPPTKRYEFCLGYNKSMNRNRAGVSLEWNILSNSSIPYQHLSASLGSEQALGNHWRIGFALRHPMILHQLYKRRPYIDHREEPIHGLHLGLFTMMQKDPWLIHGAAHFSRIEGLRSEISFIYKRNTGLGIVFSTDPVNTLFKFGICYIKTSSSLWASTMYSPLPGLSYQAAWEGGIHKK